MPKINAGKPAVDSIDIYADPAWRTITAYALAKKSEIAVRVWSFEQSGIEIECHCEKGKQCEEDGLVYRPMDDIDAQMKLQINKFRSEYGLSENKLRFFQIREGHPFEEKKLKVPTQWKDHDKIIKAREAFEKMRDR